MNRFVILGSKRSGSTLLNDLISKTGSGHPLFEPFNQFYEEMRSGWLSDDQKIFMQNKQVEPVEYLNLLFDVCDEKQSCAKVQIEHVGDETLEKIVNGPFSFIQLVRFNLTELFVSLKRAQETKQFSLTRGEKPVNVHVEINIDEAAEWMTMLFNKHCRIADMLIDKRACAIEYTDIFVKLDKVCQFTSFEPNETKMQKQATEYSWVKNLREVNFILGDQFGKLGSDEFPYIWKGKKAASLRKLLV